jgi:hypothetical protein
MNLFGQLEREFLAFGLKRFLRQVEGCCDRVGSCSLLGLSLILALKFIAELFHGSGELFSEFAA